MTMIQERPTTVTYPNFRCRTYPNASIYFPIPNKIPLRIKPPKENHT